MQRIQEAFHLGCQVMKLTRHKDHYTQRVIFLCNQGGANRDPPDQNQEEGLSSANNSLSTPPIPVPAIVKVSMMCFNLMSDVVTLLYLTLQMAFLRTLADTLKLSPLPSSKQSKTSDKNRHKKPKDVKPKVKKLKYHQYIPPDQKAEKSPPPMDSAYARLLQQQQLFLQLQILSQQKHAHAQSQQSQQHSQVSQTQVQAQQKQPTFSYQPHPQSQAQK